MQEYQITEQVQQAHTAVNICYQLSMMVTRPVASGKRIFSPHAMRTALDTQIMCDCEVSNHNFIQP